MKFPIVIKPRCGAGGKFVTIIKNEKELKKKLNSLQRKFILQEFIPSKLKLTLNLFISKEGKIARILSFRKINSIKFNGIMEELERFFQKIGYFGFASPQFLIYKNQPFLLEINPRLSYYYYGVDFGVRLYEAFHQNLIKGESVRKKIKILKFPPPLSYATKIYFKETKDILPIFLMYSFATLSSLGII
jgi:predicted ATP-grasp superfamily ATP-dependent carboligase